MPILLEAEFLTFDLGALLKNKKTADSDEPGQTTDSNSQSGIQQVSDWGAELQSRLAANRKLSLEAQETDYAIETKFFEEYFDANWDPDIAERLKLIGGPLKKALKVLGFDKETNPILAFISEPFVIELLIKPDLLNESTFKAIYNAVAKKLVAHSQFLKPNDYNVIYYPDLYRRSVGEIMEYLILQNRILRANASKYTKEDLIKNKKVFLDIVEDPKKVFSDRLAQIQETTIEINKDLSAIRSNNEVCKLNDIGLAKELAAKLGIKNYSVSVEETKLSYDSQEQLAQKLDSPVKKLAAIQYISMTTGSIKAKNALTDSRLLGMDIDSKELIKATLDLPNYLPKGKLAVKDADSLVELLLNSL